MRAEALGTRSGWEALGQSLALLMGLLPRMLWPKLQAAQCLLAKLVQLQRTGTAVQLSHNASDMAGVALRAALFWQLELADLAHSCDGC